MRTLIREEERRRPYQASLREGGGAAPLYDTATMKQTLRRDGRSTRPKQFAIVYDIKGYLTIMALFCCFGFLRARHLRRFCTLTPFVISEG